MSSERNIANPEDRQRLEQKRRELEREERQEQLSKASTRSEIASEEQPSEAPDLRKTYTVSFRGVDIDFYELGDSQIEAAKFENIDDEVEQGTKAAEYVYETMAEKSVPEWADEAWWRMYDTGAVMEVFQDLVEEATDVDEEARDRIEEFRGE